MFVKNGKDSGETPGPPGHLGDSWQVGQEVDRHLCNPHRLGRLRACVTVRCVSSQQPVTTDEETSNRKHLQLKEDL